MVVVRSSVDCSWARLSATALAASVPACPAHSTFEPALKLCPTNTPTVTRPPSASPIWRASVAGLPASEGSTATLMELFSALAAADWSSFAPAASSTYRLAEPSALIAAGTSARAAGAPNSSTPASSSTGPSNRPSRTGNLVMAVMLVARSDRTARPAMDRRAGRVRSSERTSVIFEQARPHRLDATGGVAGMPEVSEVPVVLDGGQQRVVVVRGVVHHVPRTVGGHDDGRDQAAAVGAAGPLVDTRGSPASTYGESQQPSALSQPPVSELPVKSFSSVTITIAECFVQALEWVMVSPRRARRRRPSA